MECRGAPLLGVPLRMEREGLNAELMLLWQREMAVGSYAAKWLRATGVDGDVGVLAFVANRRAANYVGGLPESETARMLSTGSGFLGTSLDCLARTHEGLAAHGITDRSLRRLVHLCRRTK